MKFKSLLYIGVAGVLSLSSCNDYLDKLPDNRIDPSTPEQLQLILVGGYTDSNYGAMCEMSSDNVVDNHAPDAKGINYPTTATYEPMDDQFFAWQDANMSSMQDSPTAVWQGCYKAIAAANHVLEKVAEFRAEGLFATGEDAQRLDAAEGEALLIRAYHHFILVNLFSMQYRGAESMNDQGIPYVTIPEKVVQVDYQRDPVGVVYQKIEEDLQNGLKKLNDQFYAVQKYHFNTSAANAFAARFYLFKREYDKAEEYANKVLGVDPSSLLRRNSYWLKNFTSLDADAATYYSSTADNNLLLLPTNSVIFRRICLSGVGTRYAYNREAATTTIYGSGPTWKNYLPTMASHLYVNGKQDYGLWPSWSMEQFQYIDKVAGIGYVKTIRNEFTMEETLLVRAEARIYLNRLDEAAADLEIWSQSHATALEAMPVLTPALIESYYDPNVEIEDTKSDPRPYILQNLNIDTWFPTEKYKVTPEKLPYLWCVLHFRKIETIFTGYRWFDIKRYGIEIEHKIGTTVHKLPMNDLRRAFQVPTEALSAGMEPTLRTETKLPVGSFTKATLEVNK